MPPSQLVECEDASDQKSACNWNYGTRIQKNNYTIANLCIMRKLSSQGSTLSNKLFAYEVYKRSYALIQKTTFQKSFNLFNFIKLGIVGAVNLTEDSENSSEVATISEEYTVVP